MTQEVKNIVKARSIAKNKRQKAEKNRQLFLKGICPSCGSSGVSIWKRGDSYECSICR